MYFDIPAAGGWGCRVHGPDHTANSKYYLAESLVDAVCGRNFPDESAPDCLRHGRGGQGLHLSSKLWPIASRRGSDIGGGIETVEVRLIVKVVFRRGRRPSEGSDVQINPIKVEISTGEIKTENSSR
jgi:hypothetical protein